MPQSRSRSREREISLCCPPPGSSSGATIATATTPVVVPCLVGNYGQSHTAVIVTHPWGPLGGNMHNNVVVAAVLYFQRMGLTTCRFDFLPHQWIFSTGLVQVEQVKQVANMLLKGDYPPLEEAYPETAADGFVRPTKILLLGYSYGSLITGSASAEIPECIATISIAPPFAVQMWLLSFRSDTFLSRAAQRLDLYRLFILGDMDNFTKEDYFQSILEKKVPSHNTKAAILRGADHFFRHREKDLMAVIGQWLQSVFVECQGDLKQLPHLHLNHAPMPSASSENQHQSSSAQAAFCA